MSSSPSVPKHIAIIMDGNGRWAKKHLLPRQMGHRAGAKAVRVLVELCVKHGIKILTLFAFSSENWQRPEKEVNTLLNLFLENLQKELPTMQENGVRLRVIGDRERLDVTLQNIINDAEQLTLNNQNLQLVLAISYGGKWDICQAAKRLASQVKEGALTANEIDEEKFAKNLSTGDLPEPDLFIRTSGEQRISNFLLWQLAYTELYFTATLWPDFDEKEFIKAIEVYRQRTRRFGLTTEQIENGET